MALWLRWCSPCSAHVAARYPQLGQGHTPWHRLPCHGSCALSCLFSVVLIVLLNTQPGYAQFVSSDCWIVAAFALVLPSLVAVAVVAVF